MLQTCDVPMPPAGLLIGGRLHEPAARIDSDDPSSGRPWTEIPWCERADVELAVAAARAAFDGGGWARAAQRRAEALRAIAATIRAHAGELAEIESRDNGKPLWATRLELTNVPRYYDWFAGAAEALHGSFFQLDAGYNVTVRREPLGVVGALIAWNSPLLLCAMKLAPALACGNAVVLKPADSASASVLRLGELLRDVEQLPAGVVNVITGGAEIGQALVAHPGVDCVSFTGGDATAEAVLATAAPALKPVKVEAGGKAAHVVFDDADLDAALTAAVAGAFISGGQSCASGARVLVHEPIWERFTAAFVARAGELRLGHPLRPGTHIGPMATDAHRRRVERYVELGVQEGATCRLGAEPPAEPELRGGFWARPATMLDVTSEMTIAQEEIFGPVPALMRFADEDEALAIANSTRYGLASGLWTRDLARAERMVDAIDAGMLWVNSYRVLHWAVPFGGWRRSGLGRENGLEALHEYTQAKSVMTATSAVAADPFELAGAT